MLLELLTGSLSRFLKAWETFEKIGIFLLQTPISTEVSDRIRFSLQEIRQLVVELTMTFDDLEELKKTTSNFRCDVSLTDSISNGENVDDISFCLLNPTNNFLLSLRSTSRLTVTERLCTNVGMLLL